MEAPGKSGKRWSVPVWLVPALCVLVVGAGVGGFFGGRASGGTPSPEEAMKVIQNLTQEQRAQLFQNGGGFVFGGGNGTTRTSGTGTRTSTSAGFTSGSILSKDASSITLKLSDGNTKIVYYSSSTTVSETKDTTADALTVGEDVVVRGSSNTDGSLTASSITVGTAETGMPGGAGAPPGGTGTPPGGTSGSTDAGATATTATTAK